MENESKKIHLQKLCAPLHNLSAAQVVKSVATERNLVIKVQRTMPLA
jgi:hypothetical protein